MKEQLSQSHSELDHEKQRLCLEASQLQRKTKLEREKHKREAEQELREVQRDRDRLKGEVLPVLLFLLFVLRCTAFVAL